MPARAGGEAERFAAEAVVSFRLRGVTRAQARTREPGTRAIGPSVGLTRARA